MDARRFVTQYLLLGLRFDALAPGCVDPNGAPPVLRRRVATEPTVAPHRLVHSARWLRRALPDVDLAPLRRTYLDAHLVAWTCLGRVLDGQPVPFRRQVESYHQVTIGLGEPDAYRHAHAELAALVGGAGDLAERLERCEPRVPAAALGPAVRLFARSLREHTRARFGLPTPESVGFDVVTGQRWAALHRYLGDQRSRVRLSADRGMRAGRLPQLVAHEAYPGHHTECCQLDGLPEVALHPVHGPRSVLSEGLAELGVHTVIGPGWGRWAQDLFAEVGVSVDGELIERLHAVRDLLRPVRQDAALLLHEHGADPAHVVRHLRRWLLVDETAAAAMLRFLADPRWRTYTSTYVEGARMLRELTADPFLHRVLSEPMVPQDVRSAVALRAVAP